LELNIQYSTFTIPKNPSTGYLILTGDIRRLQDYGLYLGFPPNNPTTRPVFLVLGNHEFYHLNYTEGIEGIERAEALLREPILEGKLVLLNCKSYSVGNTAVVGCTMW
jgi:hypothetical protein